MIEGIDEKVYSVKLSYRDLELLQIALAEIESSKSRTIVDTYYEPKNIDARKICSNINSRLSELTSTAEIMSRQGSRNLNPQDYTFVLSILEK